jgi:hypothetical protein
MILKYRPLYILRLYVELIYCCSSLINSYCHHVGIDDDSLQGVPTRTHKAEVRFEVSAVVTKKVTVFRDLKQYLPAHCQYLERNLCLHLPFQWRQQFFQKNGNDLLDHIVATHKTVLFMKPAIISHTFIIMPIYHQHHHFYFTFVENFLFSKKFCVKFVTGKLKIFHERHVCNCWLTNTISYMVCRYGYDISMQRILNFTWFVLRLHYCHQTQSTVATIYFAITQNLNKSCIICKDLLPYIVLGLKIKWLHCSSNLTSLLVHHIVIIECRKLESMEGRLLVAFILSLMKPGHLVQKLNGCRHRHTHTHTHTHACTRAQIHSVTTNKASWLSLKKDRRLNMLIWSGLQ